MSTSGTELYLSKVRVSKDVDPVKLARGTPGQTGADLEALVNTAALLAANRGADFIETQVCAPHMRIL
jgi:cell division protease FtsH